MSSKAHYTLHQYWIWSQHLGFKFVPLDLGVPKHYFSQVGDTLEDFMYIPPDGSFFREPHITPFPSHESLGCMQSYHRPS